jgi:hypothetical protein
MGPKLSQFGDVISHALDFGRPKQAQADLRRNFALAQGQIQRVYTVDDSQNEKLGKGKFTLYDVMIHKADGTTETIEKCRAVQPLFGGGINNFLEVTPTDPGPKAKDYAVSRDLKRGHMVLIGFIQGQKVDGVILGTMPHPNPVPTARRPKKGEGTVTHGEIQGLEFKVNNDGELTLTFNGPRNDAGAATSEAGPTTVKLDKDGGFTLSTNADQTVHVDRVNQKITIKDADQVIIMDQGSKKIQIQAETVEVGASALQPMVLGDDWKKLMERMVDAICDIVVPTGVGPSGTPVNKGAFKSIKSDLEKALSKNHKVQK